MKTRDLETMLIRAFRRAGDPQAETSALSLAMAIIDEHEAHVCHLAADDLHRLGDRLDKAASDAVARVSG